MQVLNDFVSIWLSIIFPETENNLEENGTFLQRNKTMIEGKDFSLALRTYYEYKEFLLWDGVRNYVTERIICIYYK